MSHAQLGAIAGAGMLVIILFFGFDTKSGLQKDIIRSTELAGTKIEITEVIKTAKESLAAQDLKNIQLLELTVESADLDAAQRVEGLKKMSSTWYQLGRPLIAGHYAKLVAEHVNSGDAWGIAGTTYIAGLNSEDLLVRNGSFAGAVEALENAISLDPDTVRHRVNLAVVYTERPPQDNPMKGIQMLLGLNERNPDNIVVLNTLARLAIKTGQYEKAQQRLEYALTIDSENVAATCMLADVYQHLRSDLAAAQRNKCDLLTTKE